VITRILVIAVFAFYILVTS